MDFVSVVPPPPLAAWVERIWDCRMALQPWQLERILPKPSPALIINLLEDRVRVYADERGRDCTTLAGSVVSGPYTGSFVIDTLEQTRVMGVQFHVGGAWPLFGEPLERLADRDVELAALVGDRIRGLRERLLHTTSSRQRLRLLHDWLLARIGRRDLHPVVRHAVRLLGRAPQTARVADIARDTGLSERRLGMLFRQQVGLTPKRFARTQRFRAVIAEVDGRRRVDWAAVAADCGFHDQPHLVHEFRRFAGMTPAAYLAARGPHANHVPLS